jgi:hypothetical protein
VETRRMSVVFIVGVLGELEFDVVEAAGMTAFTLPNRNRLRL